MLHSFSSNGYGRVIVPYAGLIFDAAGNLYGTTYVAAALTTCGTVFELTPKAGGGWTEKVLHSFNLNGTDGAYPYASLIFDAAGNLYGTTSAGGTHGNGTVFELSPKQGGGWTEKVLHSFRIAARTGMRPQAGLIFDAAGNLYGTTSEGGIHGMRDGVRVDAQGGRGLDGDECCITSITTARTVLIPTAA